MSRIDAVVFDIGQVLIEWDPEGFYDGVIGDARRRQLFSEVDLDGMNRQVDLGADFKKTIYDMADRHPDWRDEVRLWHDRWIEMATPAIDHSVQLLRALRTKGVTVFALSNFGVGSFDHAETYYPFFGEFDRRYVSGHLRMMKPDPRIYEVLETDSGVAPAALLFTDDRPENIAVAAERGWQTHLFEGPGGWAERLVAEGLLSAEEARA